VHAWAAGAIVRRVALALALGLLAPGVAAQQTDRPAWSAGLTWTGDWFEDDAPGWASWSALEARVERRFERGAAVLEAGRYRRFEIEDGVGGVDLYLELWPLAYGNAHVRVAPGADALPRSDVTLELYQGFRSGWEPAAGYRQMRFPDGTVRIGTVVVARYVGPWYARVRLAHARLAGAGGTSLVGQLRRTLRTDDEQIEAAVATGTEVVMLPGAGGAAITTDLRSTSAAALGGRVRLTGPLALALNLGYTTFEGLPARVTAGAGLIVRW
jgi:YaiO family outer membrane protein